MRFRKLKRRAREDLKSVAVLLMRFWWVISVGKLYGVKLPFSLWDSWALPAPFSPAARSIAVLLMRFWNTSNLGTTTVTLYCRSPYEILSKLTKMLSEVDLTVIAVLLMRFSNYSCDYYNDNRLPFSLWDSEARKPPAWYREYLELPFSLWDSYKIHLTAFIQYGNNCRSPYEIQSDTDFYHCTHN